jgi:hypothetical protein
LHDLSYNLQHFSICEQLQFVAGIAIMKSMIIIRQTYIEC